MRGVKISFIMAINIQFFQLHRTLAGWIGHFEVVFMTTDL